MDICTAQAQSPAQGGLPLNQPTNVMLEREDNVRAEHGVKKTRPDPEPIEKKQIMEECSRFFWATNIDEYEAFLEYGRVPCLMFIEILSSLSSCFNIT